MTNSDEDSPEIKKFLICRRCLVQISGIKCPNDPRCREFKEVTQVEWETEKAKKETMMTRRKGGQNGDKRVSREEN